MKIKLRTLSGPLNINSDDYLTAGLEVYSWLSEHRIDGNNGVYYETNPGSIIDYSDHPVHGKYGLYSGSAGIGIYLLRLYEVTGDEKYLNEVKSILDELIANVEGADFYTEKLKSAPESILKVTGWHTGIYAGPSGAGVLALEAYKKIRDERYLELARRLADDILSVSVSRDGGLTLTEDLDIFSDGGFALYFISLYKAGGEQKYLDAARDYAAFIYSRRLKGENGGEYYLANELKNVGMPEGSIYPGFAHGTAGIGYLYAVLHEADKKEWELEAAKEVALFLDLIADEVGDGKLVPYIYGGVDSDYYIGKYYIGFCHGPAGTSLLYRKLFDITGENKYKESVIKLVEGIIAAGAPEYFSWGLWNSNCACCGIPGLIEFFTDLYEAYGNERYLEYAKRAAAKAIADSSEIGAGRAFCGHWDRTDPYNVQTYTGLYSGAAGSASNLLRLYAHLNNKTVTPLWEYSYL